MDSKSGDEMGSFRISLSAPSVEVSAAGKGLMVAQSLPVNQGPKVPSLGCGAHRRSTGGSGS